MPFRSKRLRRTTLLIALALLAASCSGSSDATSEGVATLEGESAAPLGDAAAAETLEDAEPELSAEEAGLLFTQCLRDEGLDVADVGVDADGRLLLQEAFGSVDPRSEEFTEAMEVCQPLIEDAGFGQGGRAAIGENVEVQDALIEFSQCVRDAGYDVGDLTLDRGPQGGGQPADGEAEDGQPQRGQGRGQGGFGDRNGRYAAQLGLDIDDPEVASTMEACASILDAAFASAGVGAGAGPQAGG